MSVEPGAAGSPFPETRFPNEDARLARVAAKATEAFAASEIVAEWSRGGLTLVVPSGEIRAVAAFLRDDPELRFVRLSDVTGFDGLGLGREPRFAVLYRFYSFELSRWVGVRVPVDEDDAVVPSLVEEWPAANWFERETYDLFGLRFAGHPNLTRIVTPDDWTGHPLRKDYPFEPELVEYSFNVDRINAGKVVQRVKVHGTEGRRPTGGSD